MSEQKTYKIFVPESDLEKFLDKEKKVFSEMVIDETTKEQFQAKVMISQSPEEGYDKLILQGRGSFISGDWFVKIVAREEEEEEEEKVTVFESKRLGQRRGYMLRSMMAESDRSKSRKEIMTRELQKRLKQKQKIVSEMLKKNNEKKGG